MDTQCAGPGDSGRNTGTRAASHWWRGSAVNKASLAHAHCDFWYERALIVLLPEEDERLHPMRHAIAYIQFRKFDAA